VLLRITDVPVLARGSSTSYLAAVGDEQTARDRMAHMIDYTNAALRSSAYYQGSYYLRETVVRDLGEMEELRASDWPTTQPDIQTLRFKYKACGTFVASQKSHRNEALRNGPGKINPKVNNIVVSGYFASWDDGDIETAGHELGHTLGMDHNWEDAPIGPKTLSGMRVANTIAHGEFVIS